MLEKSDHSHAEKGVLHKPWEHTGLKALSWGGLATAGLALTPVVFSAFSGNVGRAAGEAITFCITGPAVGWAKTASEMLAQIPGIGPSIAAGGLATAAVSGGIAIGGMWLANYIDKRTPQGAFRWGAVIRWASLATSVLIALPAILPAISMGVMFFAALFERPNLLSDAAGMIGTLGKSGAMSGVSSALGAAGLAGVHALTCALPLGSAGLFLGQKEEKPMLRLQLPVSSAGRLMLPPLRTQAVA